MNIDIGIDNRSSLYVEGVENLIEDFLAQIDFNEESGLSIVFCENDFIKELNRDYRKKDYATDVLSFPAEIKGFLGDIVISVEKAREQASDGIQHELEMLLAHGLLHLLGYDHELGEEEYRLMMSLQDKLLKNKAKELQIKWD